VAHPGTIWLTGLPASGKTTLAVALRDRLPPEGGTAQVLDGDLLRDGINADLGFSRDDRRENVRRVSEVARLFVEAGFVVVAAVVSPHEEGRAQARRVHEAAGLPFLEVWVATSLAECERRDPKGLYARGRRGEISDVTGLDDPYEPPSSPDLVVRPGQQTIAECVEEVLSAFDRVGGSSAPAAASAPATP